MLRKSLLFIGIVIFLTACVTQRKHEEALQAATEAKKALNDCQESLAQKEAQLDEAKKAQKKQGEQVQLLEKQVKSLALDTAIAGRRYRQLNMEYKNLTKVLEKQRDVNRQLANESEQKNKKLYDELLSLEKELQQKEDKLNARDENLDQMQKDLSSREAKVEELQRLVSQKDSMMQNLKETIAQALLSFKDKGITVDVRGDKVYVSLEEQILFASGQYKIDRNVKKALVDLSKVLKDNQEVDILVEGHTDSDPIKNNCIEDNYDLSVLRATAIVRVLVEDGEVSPERVIAAGRGEHMPIASNATAEGKRKNRRIEIILTPKLDKLYNLINE